MTQFIEGLDRQQTMLLPEHLDDYVDENSLSAPSMPLPTFWISHHLASIRSLLPRVVLVIIRG
jgi:hypothetical protein